MILLYTVPVQRFNSIQFIDCVPVLTITGVVHSSYCMTYYTVFEYLYNIVISHVPFLSPLVLLGGGATCKSTTGDSTRAIIIIRINYYLYI